jgi:hypothetical protein
MENMGSIPVHEYACFIEAIICISADMGSPIDDKNPLIQFIGDPLRQYTTREAGAYDQPVKHMQLLAMKDQAASKLNVPNAGKWRGSNPRPNTYSSAA